ncbi:MAG: hypothetical protein ACR2N3_02365 [Pyrinomonadaceae bacterium]
MMMLSRSYLSTAFSISLILLSFIIFPVKQVSAQDTKVALQRGYRTGYSDGYMSGYRDSIENAARGYDRHSEYGKADRAYSKDYGTVEDYRDGYRQGFEIGYDTGFDKKSFDAVLPSELKKRGNSPPKTPIETATVTTTTPTTATITTSTTTVSDTVAANNPPTVAERTENINYVQNGDQIVVIPAETELVVELLDDINTNDSKEGERFHARVVSPNELSGAIVEGRITKLLKPGKIKRRSEIELSFDRINLSENRWANYNAILTEVLPVKGDNIKRVDTEGTVQGKDSVKSDAVKVGAATGTGLVIGAIAGGPVGAGVGAGVGAAFGVGAVLVEGGKNINIIKGQQLRIRTAYETQIR